MTVIGIICEYNPLHNGHIYQINRIKKQFPDAKIVALCSGSFVQRGEPSFISKHFKSKMAVENGIDLFLEMPISISIQSANLFSFYSVKILNNLNILDYLCFGVESLNEKDFYQYLKFEDENRDSMNLLIKEYMNKGMSYKRSCDQAIKDLGFFNDNILLPNNTLAIQYCKALKKLNSDIAIYPVDRSQIKYHGSNEVIGNIQSATTIRSLAYSSKDYANYIPYFLEANSEFINKHGIESLNSSFYYKSFVEEAPCKEIAGYEEGMLNLLKSNYMGRINTMIENSHNKRYSKARLQRFIINYLLNITRGDIKDLDYINYIHPLAFNNEGRKLLNMVKDKSSLQIVYKPKDIVYLDEINKKIYNKDLEAFKLYNIENVRNNRLDYEWIPFIDI